jgi:hypothetical protein
MWRVALVAAISLLAGCADQLQNWTIAGGAHRDATQVKHILRTVAAQAQMTDRSSGKYEPGVFAWHEGPGVFFAATQEPGDIRVSLQFTQVPYTRAFRRANSLLEPALSAAFGKRLSPAAPTMVVYD